MRSAIGWHPAPRIWGQVQPTWQTPTIAVMGVLEPKDEQTPCHCKNFNESAVFDEFRGKRPRQLMPLAAEFSAQRGALPCIAPGLCACYPKPFRMELVRETAH